MTSLADDIQEAVQVVRAAWSRTARVAMILGTGLGEVAEQMVIEGEFDYGELPHFRRSTALAHRGRLLCGEFAGVPVVTMDGRSHFYEGCTRDQLTFPVRVMRALGAEVLIASNASGGLNPAYAAGDIVVLNDHIDLMFRPHLGNTSGESPRQVLATRCPYDIELIETSLRVARREDFVAHRGVYVAVSGPNYETRAEYRMFRRIGGDAVGMSTVPEVDVASQLGMRVLAISTVTNVALPDAPAKVDAKEVVDVAAIAEPKFRKIVTAVVGGFA